MERLGRKDEIHQILRELHCHDISGRSGDGPSNLMEDILHTEIIDDDITLVNSFESTAANQECEYVDVDPMGSDKLAEECAPEDVNEGECQLDSPKQGHESTSPETTNTPAHFERVNKTRKLGMTSFSNQVAESKKTKIECIDVAGDDDGNPFATTSTVMPLKGEHEIGMKLQCDKPMAMSESPHAFLHATTKERSASVRKNVHSEDESRKGGCHGDNADDFQKHLNKVIDFSIDSSDSSYNSEVTDIDVDTEQCGNPITNAEDNRKVEQVEVIDVDENNQQFDALPVDEKDGRKPFAATFATVTSPSQKCKNGNDLSRNQQENGGMVFSFGQNKSSVGRDGDGRRSMKCIRNKTKEAGSNLDEIIDLSIDVGSKIEVIDIDLSIDVGSKIEVIDVDAVNQQFDNPVSDVKEDGNHLADGESIGALTKTEKLRDKFEVVDADSVHQQLDATVSNVEEDGKPHATNSTGMPVQQEFKVVNDTTFEEQVAVEENIGAFTETEKQRPNNTMKNFNKNGTEEVGKKSEDLTDEIDTKIDQFDVPIPDIIFGENGAVWV